jgi:urea transporter
MQRHVRSGLSVFFDEFLEAGNAVSRAYLQLLLLWDAWIGLLFMAGTWLAPHVGACGVLAVLSAYAFGRLVGIRRETWNTVNYLSNPLLVGLGLGAMLSPSWHSALFVVALSLFAFVLTVGLSAVLSSYLRLPVLTLPAVLCILPASMMAPFLAKGPAERLLAIPVWQWLPELPSEMAGFFRSLGAILFVPHSVIGLLFAVVLLARSRILLALAIGGYALGTGVLRCLSELAPEAVSLGGEYNFPLVAMALGGLFFVPSWRSYMVAAAGVTMTAMLMFVAAAGFGSWGVSTFFLPFNVVTLSLVYALGCLGFSQIPRYPGSTPEETLQIDLALRWRFSGDWRTLRLPFFGRWTVWQAFDGLWTHQGAWKHAYDFVICDERGETYSGSGLSLRDYYCYRRPIVSPIGGIVVTVVDDVADNEPGEVNSEQNWGNRVVLYDDRGFYVQVAHLAQSSVRVAVGKRVEPGTVLGLCGNSGFSPQPHLHIQVQAGAEISSATLPFSLTGCVADGVYESQGRPATGATVEPLLADPRQESRFEFLLGDELVYAVSRREQFIDMLQLKVRIAADGTLFFESGSGGRLYFAKRDGAFVLYRTEGQDPYLSLFLRTLPRLPLGSRDLLDWSETLPASLVATGIRRTLVQILSSIFPTVDRIECRLQRVGDNRIWCHKKSSWLGISEKSVVELDDRKGPATMTLGDWTLTRCDPNCSDEPQSNSKHD